MKIRSVGAQSCHSEGQTDKTDVTNLNSRFSQFCE